MEPGMNVLFICKGNICRSPIAMALFRYLAQQRGRKEVEAHSAGYYDWDPFPREAHAFARRAVEEHCGCDMLEDHRAMHWTPDMVRSASFVVVAEEWMKADFPHGNVVTMRELAGRTGDVKDPYGGDYRAYVDCALEIQGLLLAGWELLTSVRKVRR
jgi:protein-tyrosine-phosphatase